MTEESPEEKFNTDELDVTLDLTTDEGVKFPVQVHVTYPAGHGFYAVKGIQMLAEGGQLWTEMVHRGDASTVRVLLAAKEDQEGNGS